MLCSLYVSDLQQSDNSDIDTLAHQLIRITGRFSRVAGTVTGDKHSLVAWRVLADLDRDGDVRMSELSSRQRIAQPTMTGLVQRLEQEALVTRFVDTSDRRATLVSLTEQGAAALRAYRDRAAAQTAPALSQLSDFDHATLQRASELLESLANHIEQGEK